MFQLHPIKLEPAESNICRALLSFCDSYNKDKSGSQQLELRITGGWVRDKLLGKQSHDLDIAINHLSGEEFASRLLEYLAAENPQMKAQSVHTIKKNPDKSKHLETCTTKLFGLDIDFVNLRSEKYTADSRVPVIECGTAEEDALRRDATLNALFYNLNQDKIEDFTGKGLDDLRNGILRTPLAPYQTFLDDPLRVLRLIRFSSTFDFQIDSNTIEAMPTDEIKQALIHKISRERVGVELDKILMGNNPIYGLRLISHVGLTNSIFNVGTLENTINEINQPAHLDVVKQRSALIDGQISAMSTSFKVFTTLIDKNYQSLQKVLTSVLLDTHLQKLFYLSTVLLPYENAVLRANPKRAAESAVPELILKEGLRLGKHDFEPVSTIVKEHKLAITAFQAFFDSHTIKRSELGTILAKYKAHSSLSVLVYAFAELLQNPEFKAPVLIEPHPQVLNLAEQLLSQSHYSLSKYENLMRYIENESLWDVHNVKPLVDGKTLSKELNKKPGPWMGEVTNMILVWQLDHPLGTKEECIEFIKSQI